MGAINDIFKSFGPEYLDRYGDTMPDNHKKAIQDIVSCRTEAQGLAVYQCQECNTIHMVYKSCGNRHCPSCQYHKTRQWLEKQKQGQLPGHHFMLTFTMPQEIRDFIHSNQRVCYAAMFKASSDSIKKLAKDPKFIGGDLAGFFGVLHTWGRQQQYHPHIHYIAPGGAVTDGEWLSSYAHFFLPVHALSKICKAKFKHEMDKAGLLDEIPEDVWQKDWNVNSQAVPTQEHCIEYLAPYIFRVAISNSRIVKVEERRVFFKYRKKGSRRMRTTSLDVMEFMHRFLQHVLPSGFMKVRYYGFLHPNCSTPLEEIADIIRQACELTTPVEDTVEAPSSAPTAPVCSVCGGPMVCKAVILPCMMAPIGYG